MEITNVNSLASKLLTLAITLLIIATGWLAARHPVTFDASLFASNSLSPTISNLLRQLPEAVRVVAHIDDRPELRRRIKQALEPYQRVKPDIQIDWDNPALSRQTTSLQSNGELILEHNGNRAIIQSLRPEELNRAFHQLARGSQRWVAFLQSGQAFPLDDREPKGYAKLNQVLKQQGYARFSIDPEQPIIPENIDVLVVKATQLTFGNATIQTIRQWVDSGRALMWLQESKPDLEAQLLLTELGLKTLPGLLVDAEGSIRESLGLRHPAVIGSQDYGSHITTDSLKGPTLFPVAQAFQRSALGDWKTEELIFSSDASWNETSEMSGKLDMDATNEFAGPHALGMALTRQQNHVAQRVIVMGDSDFLSNDYLGYGKNSAILLSMVTWLSGDDALLDSDYRLTPDVQLNFTQTQLSIIAGICLILLPLLLLLTGARLWYLRRHA